MLHGSYVDEVSIYLAERFMTDCIGLIKELQEDLGDIFYLKAPGKKMVVLLKKA